MPDLGYSVTELLKVIDSVIKGYRSLQYVHPQLVAIFKDLERHKGRILDLQRLLEHTRGLSDFDETNLLTSISKYQASTDELAQKLERFREFANGEVRVMAVDAIRFRLKELYGPIEEKVSELHNGLKTLDSDITSQVQLLQTYMMDNPFMLIMLLTIRYRYLTVALSRAASIASTSGQRMNKSINASPELLPQDDDIDPLSHIPQKPPYQSNVQHGGVGKAANPQRRRDSKDLPQANRPAQFLDPFSGDKPAQNPTASQIVHDRGRDDLRAGPSNCSVRSVDSFSSTASTLVNERSLSTRGISLVAPAISLPTFQGKVIR
jgi:hypothetical protein